ncbi:MAG: hypothetical protein AAF799_28815 [Myxococcota bacterium]
MTDERRYDDREVGLILKRVAELHERAGDKTDARSMSEAEIEQVVTELGISKALVARAVSEVSVADQRTRPKWMLGGKTDLMFETSVDGRLDDAALTPIIEVLRRSLGDPGELKNEGTSRIWSTSKATTRRVHLSVVEHSGKTTVRLEERMPMDAKSTVGLGAFTGGMGGFSTVIPLKALLGKATMMLAWGPLIGVGVGLGWLVGRAIWKRRSDGRETQLSRAFGEIVAIVGNERKALPEVT